MSLSGNGFCSDPEYLELVENLMRIKDKGVRKSVLNEILREGNAAALVRSGTKDSVIDLRSIGLAPV